jgi:hypothetical protein
LNSVDEAISFIESYITNSTVQQFAKFEIEVRFNNGDRIEATFRSKADAVRFLNNYRSPFEPFAE